MGKNLLKEKKYNIFVILYCNINFINIILLKTLSLKLNKTKHGQIKQIIWYNNILL